MAGLMNDGVARLCDILARIAREGHDVNIWRQLGARPSQPYCGANLSTGRPGLHHCLKAHPEPGRRASLHAGVVMGVADHAAVPILNVWENVYRVESYAPWHMASRNTISRLRSKTKGEWVMAHCALSCCSACLTGFMRAMLGCRSHDDGRCGDICVWVCCLLLCRHSAGCWILLRR